MKTSIERRDCADTCCSDSAVLEYRRRSSILGTTVHVVSACAMFNVVAMWQGYGSTGDYLDTFDSHPDGGDFTPVKAWQDNLLAVLS